MNSSLRAALALSLLVASVPTTAGAAGPIQFGVKAGMSFSNVDPSDIAGGVAKLQTMKSAGGGGFAMWGLNERFGIQGEVLYVSKGFSYGDSQGTDTQGNPTGTFESLQVVDYVEVPVLARAAWQTGGRFVPAIAVGPTMSFKVSEHLKTTGATEESVKTDHFESFDAGFAAGADVRFRIGPGWSLVEARYTLGLTDAAKGYYSRDEKNRALTIMAGYVF